VLIVPCLVQGSEAPAQIVDALANVAWLHRQALSQGQAGVDTLILCRGGGSLEDLWSFNDERVVRAVSASSVPVVCGVGHETDITLADLAADLRAPTPTAAAELVARSRDDAMAELDGLSQALRWRIGQRLDQQAQQLDRLGLRLSRPGHRVQQHAQHLVHLQGRLAQALQNRLFSIRQSQAPLAPRLDRALAQRLAWARQQQAHLALRLEALNPQRVLERGYAWLSTPEGEPITRAAQAQLGQALNVQMADGQLEVAVSGVVANNI
jgi:exodeoxyribonuclease VII large subunit